MKLTIQKILICAFSLIVSIAACVCGMYLTILAHMQIGYRILFCLIFMLNPVLVIFMIRFMFRKAVPKDAAEGEGEHAKKKKWGKFSKKDEPEVVSAEEDLPPEEPAYETSSYSTEGTYSDSFGVTDTESQVSMAEPSSATYAEPVYADEVDDELNFAEPSTEKISTPITEESVEGVKKISLRKKKR